MSLWLPCRAGRGWWWWWRTVTPTSGSTSSATARRATTWCPRAGSSRPSTPCRPFTGTDKPHLYLTWIYILKCTNWYLLNIQTGDNRTHAAGGLRRLQHSSPPDAPARHLGHPTRLGRHLGGPGAPRQSPRARPLEPSPPPAPAGPPRAGPARPPSHHITTLHSYSGNTMTPRSSPNTYPRFDTCTSEARHHNHLFLWYSTSHDLFYRDSSLNSHLKYQDYRHFLHLSWWKLKFVHF